MGVIKLFSSSSYDDDEYDGPIIGGSWRELRDENPEVVYQDRYVPDPRNPDASKYVIVRHRKEGKFLIVEMNYPNCTNYEGDKILVYKDITITELKRQKLIDPHFSENQKFHSPIARFVPTEEGWRMAVIFAQNYE